MKKIDPKLYGLHSRIILRKNKKDIYIKDNCIEMFCTQSLCGYIIHCNTVVKYTKLNKVY